ncbi:MAG: hypothetical protein RIS63_35 [Bacteroidota bacterium]|jgi:hypothetical protein
MGMLNTRGFIDEKISDLLYLSINQNIKAVSITKVINILLDIDKSLDDVIIDGDELNKYFNKTKPL